MAKRYIPPFKTEKELCDYLEVNMELFCKEIIGDKLVSYKREGYLTERFWFGGNLPRIDFDIVTENKRILVECKNPSQRFAEMSRAISQLLTYATLASSYSEMILVTSGTLPIVQQTIVKFKLPIKVVYLTKEVLAEWTIEFEKKLLAGEIQVEEQYAIPQ